MRKKQGTARPCNRGWSSAPRTARPCNRGSTLVELVMVMMLIALFGLTLTSLVYSGSETQRRIIEEKDAQIDARVALSYINMRLRQSDAVGKISVEPNEITGENSIVIRERGGRYEYDTWIYWAEGFIYECLVGPGLQPSVVMSQKIARIDEYTLAANESGTMVNTIRYTSNNKTKEMSSTIYLRSLGAQEG